MRKTTNREQGSLTRCASAVTLACLETISEFRRNRPNADQSGRVGNLLPTLLGFYACTGGSPLLLYHRHEIVVAYALQY